MPQLHFGQRLRQFFWKPDIAAEIRDEVDHHLELLTGELMAKGMSREDAASEARRRFGARTPVEQYCREMAAARDRDRSRAAWLADIRDDLRYGLRSLRHNPGYTATAGLTLAVAIAANALVFTLVNGVLLQQLPYGNPEELVVVEELTAQGGDPWELSAPTLDDVRSSTTRLQSITGWLETELTLQGEESLRIPAALVDEHFFPTLQATTLLGHPLTEEDFGPAHSAVLSHELWKGRFGGDSGILGRQILLNSEQFTVVGVMSRSFDPSAATQLWLGLGGTPDWMLNRSVHTFETVARLKPDVSPSVAESELRDIGRRIQQDHPGEDPGHTLSLRPLHTAVTGNVRTTLLVLFGAVLAMLLLACANMAGLTLTRVRARDGEFAVRAALGASPGRLIRQLLVEGALLASLGALAGLLLASVGLSRILTWLPSSLPRTQEIQLDGRVVLFTLLLSAGCGLLLGLIPAFHAGRLNLRSRLTPTGKGTIAGTSQFAHGSLVVVQMALCLILVIAAGLLIRSFNAAQSVDPGFEDQDLVTFTLSLPSARYEGSRVVTFYQELPERLHAIPGVSAVSAVSSLPISGGDGVGGLTIEGRDLPQGDETNASFRRILPNYFQIIGVPLLRGREFTAQDQGGPEMVVVISESMARHFWPNQSPLGQRIKVGPPENEPWLTVVGVVANVHNIGLETSPRYDTYEPHAQRPRGTMSVVLHGSGDPAQIGLAARTALREFDAELPIWGMMTMTDRIDQSLAPRRFNAAVLSAFGAVALGLALLGVYAVTANGVASRRQEFGIRMALGAEPVSIRNLVVRQGLFLAALGVAIGLPAALLVSGALREMLFGISPTDPSAYAIAAILLAAAALLASWFPALRATRVSPMSALREE